MFPLLCLGSCVNICQIQFSLWTFRQSYMKHHLFFARHYPTRTLCSCPSESQAVNFKTHFNDFFSPAHIFEYHPYLQIKTPLFQQILQDIQILGLWKFLASWWFQPNWKNRLVKLELSPQFSSEHDQALFETTTQKRKNNQKDMNLQWNDRRNLDVSGYL